MIRVRLFRNVACLIFALLTAYAINLGAKAPDDVCTHRGCTCYPYGFGWVAACPEIQDCASTYPSFCNDFQVACWCGWCTEGSGSCWAYCPTCEGR
jgi:hypothetical protein